MANPHQREAVQAPSRLIVPSQDNYKQAQGASASDSTDAFDDPSISKVPGEYNGRMQDIQPSGFEMIDRQGRRQEIETYPPEPQEDNYYGRQRDPYSGRTDRWQTEVAPAPSSSAIKVGILLPLSGDKKELGQAMLNAAQMALFDVGSTSFELLPRDTKGTPNGAMQAAQSALSDGAHLLLGPLFASSVEAAKPVANRYRVNMIAFSTDWMLADNNTFIMGFLPFAQVQRISEYAAKQGLQRIGVIAPNDVYGNVVTRTFREYSNIYGLEIVDIVKYNPLQKDMSPAIRTFTDYDRRVGLLEQQKKNVQAQLAASPGNEMLSLQLAELEKMTSMGDAPFDAVLMPMGGEQARTLANLLSYYDLGPEKVVRLGTGLWDDPSLANETHLGGSLFAAPSPNMRLSFERRYKQLYGAVPPRLASLAYDATALAAVVSRKNSDRSGKYVFDRQTLINPNGFAGIDGIFRFRPDGLIERGLSVLQYQNGKIREVEPAPQTFELYGKS
jgi:hypothetical protein